jgi:hypothetical protein
MFRKKEKKEKKKGDWVRDVAHVEDPIDGGRVDEVLHPRDRVAAVVHAHVPKWPK